MIVDQNKIKTFITLISDWSDAVAREETGERELQHIKDADREMGFTVGQAICAVEACYDHALQEPWLMSIDLPNWHPEHPESRLKKIRELKSDLGFGNMSLEG